MRAVSVRYPFLVLALLAAGCEMPEPTPAAVQPFASVCDEANVGQRLGVRGYLRLPETNTGDFSIVLRLYETPDFSGRPIGVSVRLGDLPNRAETLPSSYTDEDLAVRLADGTVTSIGTPVVVSGSVYAPVTEQEFACGLENVFLAAG
jgi:hypothetical protein